MYQSNKLSRISKRVQSGASTLFSYTVFMASKSNFAMFQTLEFAAGNRKTSLFYMCLTLFIYQSNKILRGSTRVQLGATWVFSYTVIMAFKSNFAIVQTLELAACNRKTFLIFSLLVTITLYITLRLVGCDHPFFLYSFYQLLKANLPCFRPWSLKRVIEKLFWSSF